MRNVSDKSCRENQNTHFVFSNFFCLPENRAVYEVTWKNKGRAGHNDNIIRRMRIACCTPKAKNTHSEHVILNVFPLQQRLHEGASLYIAVLFSLKTNW
jgi:hypothetical protein